MWNTQTQWHECTGTHGSVACLVSNVPRYVSLPPFLLGTCGAFLARARLPLRMTHTGTSRTPFSASSSPSVSPSVWSRDVVFERVLGTLPAPLTLALRAAELDELGALLNYPREEPCAMQEVLTEVLGEVLGERGGTATLSTTVTSQVPAAGSSSPDVGRVVPSGASLTSTRRALAAPAVVDATKGNAPNTDHLVLVEHTSPLLGWLATPTAKLSLLESSLMSAVTGRVQRDGWLQSSTDEAEKTLKTRAPEVPDGSSEVAKLKLCAAGSGVAERGIRPKYSFGCTVGARCQKFKG